METNHYRTLGVHKHSTESAIKLAWNLLARINHPDKTNNDPAAADRMAMINVAYGVLKNPKERKRYDKVLALTGTTCPACQGKAVIMKQKGYSKKIAAPCDACCGCGVV